MDVRLLNISALHQAYVSGDLSVEAVVSAYLDVITRKDEKLGAFLEVFGSAAIKRAEELDQRLRNGEKPNGLFGVPVALKDNLCLAGTKTTAASKILANYVAPYTATAVEKLLASGAVVLGKTNMDEFAMGSSTENSSFQKTKNPWDTQRVPGGSSGGSAAAVASLETLVALGSDTGGSIRQPASFCGVVGFKPTYGRVSRHGLIALASSLDQIGPFARNVEDAFRVYATIAGPDPYDPTTVTAPIFDAETLQKGFKNLKVGILKDAQIEGMDESVAKNIKEAIRLMKNSGVEVVELSIPRARLSLAVYYLIVTSEVSSNLARYDGIRYGLTEKFKASENFLDFTTRVRAKGFGAETQRRILLGTFTLSKGYADRYYRQALQLKSVITQDFAKAFKNVDVIFGPTAPTVAFKLGEKFEDPLTMYLSDIFTDPANIANLPAVSLPIGFAHQLPVGGQFMGPSFREDLVFQAAAAFEKISGITDLIAPAA
ncbi:Asp-tRNA(Asn)/Glu-tRNA(Gln) amidotransferase subunit GatA [Candidatus Parcubacteria bacterium]|jgi:aspartyl-tRNA(Asn)/glutamyl-tRNA(Gln) amidotransferase subunit A|nr:MAG: Asp-tRNA(Asn)/Glu-tRNA(Gln) amidotransferase subunit GatA [Candidatus Parcubacteria bacterium]